MSIRGMIDARMERERIREGRLSPLEAALLWQYENAHLTQAVRREYAAKALRQAGVKVS